MSYLNGQRALVEDPLYMLLPQLKKQCASPYGRSEESEWMSTELSNLHLLIKKEMMYKPSNKLWTENFTAWKESHQKADITNEKARVFGRVITWL